VINGISEMDQAVETVTIFSYDNEVEAGHDRGFLEAHGIEVEVSGMFHRETRPIELRVRLDQAQEAGQLLESLGRNVVL
jgi:hypothetical protein